MKRYLKAVVATVAIFYLFFLVGCATPPMEEEINEKDVIIKNLTEENAALTQEIEKLTKEKEMLMQQRVGEESETKDIK